MENVITIAVVLVFTGIVFRKRLASLFRKKTETEHPEPAAVKTVDPEEPPEKKYVYFKAFGIDASEYLNVSVLSEAIDNRLHAEADLINRTYVGEIMDIDYKIENDLILFLIKWHT